MSWLTNYVRPKIRALVSKSDVPDNLWTKCSNCGQMIFHRDLTAGNKVCPNCDHHMRLTAEERLKLLFDGGTYELLELAETVQDPLRFRDQQRYTERLKKARSATGLNDAIQVAVGEIGGQSAVVAAFDFRFMGGSMGVAVGEGFIAGARAAVERKAAFIAIPASGGARMQEGILSLMQMPRTVIAVEMVKDAGLPYIVILTDPTTGGVTASFAMLGDVTLAEPGAVIGFAGTRVIEETIRETLPAGFQRAEYLHEHGMVDMVVPRKALRATLCRVLDLLMVPQAPEATEEPPAETAAEPAESEAPDEVAEEASDTAPKAAPETAPETAGETTGETAPEPEDSQRAAQ